MSFAFSFPISVVWLAKLILRHKIDVVHTNTSVLPAGGVSARLTGRRHFWHIREFFTEFPAFWNIYQQYIGLFSTKIIANSQATREQFLPHLREKCCVVYNGLEAEAGMVERSKAKEFRTLFGDPIFLIGVVGRIKWVRKGQEVLVNAAALLKDKFPEVRYAIVGSCALGNEDHLVRLRELIRDRGLEERFLFAGELEELRDVYAAFDLTVVPSVLPEPFGCVVVESMAAGTPVVGSRCGGIPEQIVDGVTGRLFIPGDEVDLARVLASVIPNDSLRSKMADESRRRFQTFFTLDSTCRSFVEVIGAESPPLAKPYRVVAP